MNKPNLARPSSPESAKAMNEFDFQIYDVFTKSSFTGNPLAVVLDARGLTTGQMQAIAQQFNLSETVFLLPPDNPVHSARARIFTPAYEMPFAGHPTIGAAIALAESRHGRAASQDTILVLEENVGPVRCAVTILNDGASFCEFDSPRLSQEIAAAPSEATVAQALGLAAEDIGFDRHRPSVYSAGAPFAYVPVKSLDVLAKAWPAAGFKAAVGDAVGMVVYARLPEDDDFSFQVRMFAPDAGVMEDPATGGAAAAFAGVLAAFEGLPEGQCHRPILQGVEMGRRSEIALEIEVTNGALSGCRIGGHAVLTASGRMKAPL
jgi:trans-2,3-dihydro-3-hydroxyanthranilate isomerase